MSLDHHSSIDVYWEFLALSPVYSLRRPSSPVYNWRLPPFNAHLRTLADSQISIQFFGFQSTSSPHVLSRFRSDLPLVLITHPHRVWEFNAAQDAGQIDSRFSKLTRNKSKKSGYIIHAQQALSKVLVTKSLSHTLGSDGGPVSPALSCQFMPLLVALQSPEFGVQALIKLLGRSFLPPHLHLPSIPHFFFTFFLSCIVKEF